VFELEVVPRPVLPVLQAPLVLPVLPARLVRPEQADEAIATIEAYRNNPTTDADEAVSEEPA